VGQFRQWKTEEKVIVGCRGFEHVNKSKTLVSQKHTLVALYTGHMHTRAALLKGHVPVDRLISVEDCCLILVGAEGVS
jgi:hypothetical protein